MRIEDFDYELPPERIARHPLPERDRARLLVLDRAGGIAHRTVRDLPDLLGAGDLLVLNETRVIPARLVGRKPTGGRVELLLVEAEGPDGPEQRWRALYTASKPLRPGASASVGGLVATLEEPLGDGIGRFLLRAKGGVGAAIRAAGEVPLPPYLGRSAEPADRERYQTVYARVEGAVAAPTAGLHFTPDLLARMEARGVEIAPLTLHVGPGTFLPVRAEHVEDHRMHEEAYDVPERTARAWRRARAEARRVVAVGTTSARALEAAAAADGEVRPGAGRTDLFIFPGHAFRAVDALLTNFHLPRSTLLLLVAAFAGRKRILDAYEEAVRSGYRFYSYGDAMLLL
jgi:S-adenosylmethionine:tRNA ribosyltransferase-isomerase